MRDLPRSGNPNSNSNPDSEASGSDVKAQRPWSLDDLIPLVEAAKRSPGRPNVSTVYRWVQKGVHGVRLKVVSVGRTRFTTSQWLREFFESTEAARRRSEADDEAPTVAAGPPRRQRRRRRAGDTSATSRRTRETLRRHGLDDSLTDED